MGVAPIHATYNITAMSQAFKKKKKKTVSLLGVKYIFQDRDMHHMCQPQLDITTKSTVLCITFGKTMGSHSQVFVSRQDGYSSANIIFIEPPLITHY